MPKKKSPKAAPLKAKPSAKTGASPSASSQAKPSRDFGALVQPVEFSASDERRLNELSAKEGRDGLSPTERAERGEILARYPAPEEKRRRELRDKLKAEGKLSAEEHAEYGELQSRFLADVKERHGHAAASISLPGTPLPGPMTDEEKVAALERSLNAAGTASAESPTILIGRIKDAVCAIAVDRVKSDCRQKSGGTALSILFRGLWSDAGALARMLNGEGAFGLTEELVERVDQLNSLALAYPEHFERLDEETKRRLLNIYHKELHARARAMLLFLFRMEQRYTSPRAQPDRKVKLPRKARIRISKDGSTVTIDGKPHRLRGEHARAFVQALLEKRGKAVLTTTLQRLGIRADREYKKVPPELRQLIDKPGRGRKGYILY